MRHLEGLNEEQLKIVMHKGGPAAVYAGPGSGKTKTLVAHLIQLLIDGNFQPETIVVTTFTRRAAAELRERIEQAVRHEPSLREEGAKLNIGTIHSFCLDLLRRQGHLVLTGISNLVSFDFNDILLLISVHGDEIGLGRNDFNDLLAVLGPQSRSAKDRRPMTYESFLSQASKFFAQLSEAALDDIDLGELSAESAEAEFFVNRYKNYIKLSDEMGFLDHSLILKKTYAMLTNPEILCEVQKQYKYFLVDEYQDTNLLQDRIFRKLSSADGNLLVVGDEDQSIYGFRGANVKLFLNFAGTWDGSSAVKKYFLEGNYRSAKEIVDHFNEFKLENFPQGEIFKKSRPMDQEKRGYVFKLTSNDASELAELMLLKIRGLIRSQSIQSPYVFVIIYRSMTGQCAEIIDRLKKLCETDFTDIPIEFGGDKKMLKNQQVRVLLEILRQIADALAPPVKPRKPEAKYILAEVEMVWENIVQSELISDLKGVERNQAAFYVHRLLCYLLRHAPFAVALPGQNTEMCPTSLTYYFAKLTVEAARFDRIIRRAYSKPGYTIRSFIRYLEVADHSYEKGGKDAAVNIMTMHAAKGLEWPVAILLSPEDFQFAPREFNDPFSKLECRLRYGVDWVKLKDEQQQQDELRLFYVAQSRAQSILCYAFEKQIALAAPILKAISGLKEWGPIASKLELKSKSISKRRIQSSHSDLLSNDGCSHRYNIEKVYGFEGKPVPQLYEGKSLHGALQIFHESILCGKRPSLVDLNSMFDKAWLPIGQSANRGQKRKLKMKKVFLNYAQNFDHLWVGHKVLGVEQATLFEFEINGQYLLLDGRIDLLMKDQSGKTKIVEFKTQVATDDLISIDSQLAIYQLGLGLDKAGRAVLDIKNLKIHQFEEISAEQCSMVISPLASKLVEGFVSGKFPPTEDLSKCRRCSLVDVCAVTSLKPSPLSADESAESAA